jgi:PKHD-type hydroxylase
MNSENNAIYPYWINKNAINSEICRNIIDLGKDRWESAKINQEDVDKNIRKTDVAWSNESWLYELCWRYLHTANRESNWNFEISACEPMQITKYNKNGHYNFHQDGNGFFRYNSPENNFLHSKTRKLSMTIVLNEDYDGGEFEFFNDINLIKEKVGTVIVFPSYMVHKVRTITKGVRYSLVAWFCGEPFK